MIAITANEKIGLDLTKKLWGAFLDMAGDKTSLHEFHNKLNISLGEFQHSDGWGCVWLDQTARLQSFHSMDPVWETDLPNNFLQKISTSRLFILHARKASPGLDKGIEYCHPFIRTSPVIGEVAFCHNGTIEDFNSIKYADHYKQTIQSDSELFLYNVLTQMENNQDQPISEIVSIVIESLPPYSGANFILYQSNKLIASTNYTNNPKYLTMKYHLGDNYIVISSENISNIADTWQDLSNHHIIEIELTDRMNHVIYSPDMCHK